MSHKQNDIYFERMQEDAQDILLEQSIEYIRMCGFTIIEAYSYITVEKEGNRLYIPFQSAIDLYEDQGYPDDEFFANLPE